MADPMPRAEQTEISTNPAGLIIRARAMSRSLPDRQALGLLALAHRLEFIVGEIRRIRRGLDDRHE